MVSSRGHGEQRPWFRCKRNNREDRVSPNKKKMEVTWNLRKAASTIYTCCMWAGGTFLHCLRLCLYRGTTAVITIDPLARLIFILGSAKGYLTVS
jgi:hypothetical protein